MEPIAGDPVGLMESAYQGNKGLLDRINREARDRYSREVADYKRDYPVAFVAKQTDPATVLPERPVPPKQFELQHDAYISMFSLYESRLSQFLLGNGTEPPDMHLFDSAIETTLPDALAGWTIEGPAVAVPDNPVGGFMYQNDAGQDVYGVAPGALDVLVDGDVYEPLQVPGGPMLTAFKKKRFGNNFTAYWTKTTKGVVAWPYDPALNMPDAKKAKKTAPAQAAK
jgi:hypothetical protein